MAKDFMTTTSRSEKIKATKEKKAAEAEAKRIESNITRDLDRMREFKHLFANPTRTFKLGDEVKHLRANWDNIKVIAVEDDGLFYRIGYGGVNNNYGKPEKYTSEAYASWKDLVLKDQEMHKENFNKREELRGLSISFHNSQLDSLIHHYYYFGVDMNPDYQRELVWTAADKEALIDSIFNGIEIGKFVFIHRSYESGEPALEILDGKQRLSALIEFVEDRFTYKGLKYSELSWADRNWFSGYNITKGETQEKLTPAQKYNYFLRLNTQGKPQSEEHIAKVRAMLEQTKRKDK